MKSKIQIVEVCLRDGLQNEKQQLSIQQKKDLAKKLIAAGVSRLELGAFVRPVVIPQMTGTLQVVSGLRWPPNVIPSVLVPNLNGLEQALQTNIPEVAVFTACSETFNQKNINCSIDESFQRFAPVVKLAKKNKIRVRGYLSTCFFCPFEGLISERKVVDLTLRLLELGCFEVSIGDTIGAAGPSHVQSVFRKIKREVSLKKIAGHFHDTRGTALTNIYASLQQGVEIFDSSLGGLGGCPFAPGSSGNVATEDVVFMLHEMGLSTGLDLRLLNKTSLEISKWMHKKLPAKVSNAPKHWTQG